MWQYAIKVALSAVLIVAITEIAKRNTWWAAALASLPLTSLLAFVWLHLETRDPVLIASLAQNIFWLVLPSLVLFVLLPLLLKAGWSFWPSLALSSFCTMAAYAAVLWVLTQTATASS